MAVSARIQQIYLALFGRPADPVGGEFYDTLTHDGSDLTAILTGSSRLSGSAEYTTRFTGMSNTQIVETIYQSLFGHPADLAGLTFYTQAMANADAQANGQPLPFPAVPTYTIEQIAVGILDGATGTDAAIIANKTAAAVEFTDSLDTPAEIAAYQGDNAADFGRDFINGVTTDPDTIPTQAQVDASLNNLVNNVANGLSVNLTGDVDNVTTNVADTLHTSAANDVIRGTVDVGFFGSGGGTFNNGDQVNGGEGYDRLELTNVSQGGPFSSDPSVIATLTNVEELSVRNIETDLYLDATSWDANLEKVTVHDSYDDNNLEIDGLKSNVDVNFVNSYGGIDLYYAAGAVGANASVNVNVDNSDVYLDAYTDGSDTIATLNINSTGIPQNADWNDLSYDDNDNGDLTTVNVTGDSAISLSFSDESALATFNAGGSTGGVRVDLSDSDVDLTVTGSSNDDYITVNLDNANTVNLGKGDDHLTLDSLSNNGHLDGGDGKDTLNFSYNSDLQTATATSAFGATISNFEVLAINEVYSSSLTVDLHNLDDINDVQLHGVDSGYTLTLNNFSSGGTIELNANDYYPYYGSIDGTLNVSVATDTLADSISIDTNGESTAGTINLTGFETINLVTGEGLQQTIANLSGDDATTLHVTGVAGVDFGVNIATNLAALTTVDASGVTGTGSQGSVNLNLAASTHDLTVSTGAGNDTVVTGAHTDTINTGAGNDTITAGGGADTITTGAGNDVIHYTVTSDSTGTATDTIVDFTTGQDKLDFTGLVDTATPIANPITVHFLGNANGFVAANTALTDHAGDAVFDSASHQLYIDVDGNGAIDSGDMVITLTGVSSLSDGDFVHPAP